MFHTESRRARSRWLRVVAPMFLIPAVWGCATGGTTSPSMAPTPAPAPDAPRDPKAHLSLAEIEPVVTPPVAPDTVRPLSERAVQRLNKADTFVAEDRFTEASIELERAMRYEPNHPRIHAALGLLHWKARNIERARDHAGRAIAGNPDSAAPHYVLARCHLERGDRVNAITSLRRALLCTDFSANFEIAALTRYHLASALAGEGYAGAALDQIEQFQRSMRDVTDAPDGSELRPLLQRGRSPVVLMRADLFEQLGRYAEAATALEAVVGDAADVATWVRLAGLQLRADDTDGALRTVRRIQSDEPSVIDLLFEIHQQRGHPEDALVDLQERMVLRPDSAALSTAIVEVQLKLGRVDEALAVLREQVERDGSDQTASDRLVTLLLEHGKSPEAFEVCASAVTRLADRLPNCVEEIVEQAARSDGPVDPRVLAPPTEDDRDYALGYLYARVAAVVDRADASLAWLERSHELSRKFIPTRVALTRAYMEQFRYDEAIAVAQRAAVATPEDAQLEQLLGLVYERLDDLPNAEVHLRAATQLDRSDVTSMYALARAYRRSGKSNLAQRQLRVLLSTERGHEGGRELLAVMYMREGKGQAAFEQIEALKKYSTKPTTIARCESLLDGNLRQDVEAVRAHLLAAMEVGTPDAPTWIAVAETYSAYESAKQREAYAAALRLDPDHDEASLALVQAMQLDLDFESAEVLLRQMLRRRPYRTHWHIELINVLTTLQKYDEAVAHAEAQAQRDGIDGETRRDYRLRMMQTLRSARRGAALIQRLETWSESDPEDSQWRRWLGDEYMNQDQAEKAVEIRRAMYDAAPDDWSALGALVAALAGAKRTDRAIQYVFDRLEVDPESDNAVWMLASLLADGERLDEAIELVHTRLRGTFQRQFFQDFLIAQLQRAGRYDEAIDYVESLHDEAVALLADAGAGRRPGRGDSITRQVLQPNETRDPQALSLRVHALRERLGLALIGAKRFADARQRVTTWIEQASDPAIKGAFLRLMAFGYRAEGNELRATEFMHQALADAPNDVVLNNDVAYGWIDQGVRLEEAERMSRFALGARPQQGAYLDTYGWLLYKKGDFPGAIKWLDRSRNSATGEDPVVHDHLGDAYWRSGDPAKAVELWTKAAELAGAKNDEDIISADENRVKDTVQQKIDAAGAGRAPDVAPLALPDGDAEKDES